jgi:hypothetical protein
MPDVPGNLGKWLREWYSPRDAATTFKRDGRVGSET